MHRRQKNKVNERARREIRMMVVIRRVGMMGTTDRVIWINYYVKLDRKGAV